MVVPLCRSGASVTSAYVAAFLKEASLLSQHWQIQHTVQRGVGTIVLAVFVTGYTMPVNPALSCFPVAYVTKS